MNHPMADWIVPDWPAPARVRALVTTRAGGVSAAPYATMNLGAHVGDDPAAVAENRRRLRACLPSEPLWLTQVHGCRVAHVEEAETAETADAVCTRQRGKVCAVLTADCLPVLLCDEAGVVVCAAHAGWRGLAGGVIEAALRAMATPPAQLMAWLGPAIGPRAFEVGDDVRNAFLAHAPDAATAAAFTPAADGKWRADLYRLATLRLNAAGVERVFGGGFCTWEESRFYSFRRDKTTGRMASLIWMA
ncbi:MAG: peptidoglycan editing factor PgeF [Zoogloeaceae bacterium]|jgi:YfiH family protein|nr:peptidoglycan editing factor PgeF [Zoogloeaceae bacterium]